MISAGVGEKINTKGVHEHMTPERNGEFADVTKSIEERAVKTHAVHFLIPTCRM